MIIMYDNSKLIRLEEIAKREAKYDKGDIEYYQAKIDMIKTLTNHQPINGNATLKDYTLKYNQMVLENVYKNRQKRR